MRPPSPARSAWRGGRFVPRVLHLELSYLDRRKKKQRADMFWRLLTGFCALTFLGAGIRILGNSDTCEIVTIGGTRGQMTYAA